MPRAALLLRLAAALAAAIATGACATAGDRAETAGPSAAAARATRSAPFTTPITSAPRLAAGSSAMVRGSIVRFRGNANLANSDAWGVPIVIARRSDPTRTIAQFRWSPGQRRRPIRFRIPAGARPSTGSDHHLAVIDGGEELDLWAAERRSARLWRAGAWAVVPKGSVVAGRIAATAAGFTLTAGLVRPAEIRAGHIDHALLLTSPYVRDRHVPPAVHGDGRVRSADALPMGSRLQLDPRVDISGLPRTQRIIARALQEYGAYLGDSADSLAIRAEAGMGRDIWGPAGVRSSSLRAIPWSRLRVIAP